MKLDQARTGEQRRIHLEERVFRCRTDEHHDAILHRMEQRVLLGAVEAMDLIDEQDGAQIAMDQTLISFRDDLAQIAGHRRQQRQGLDRQIVDLLFHVVDAVIRLDDLQLTLFVWLCQYLAYTFMHADDAVSHLYQCLLHL